MATSWRALSPLCTPQRGEETPQKSPQKNQGRIRGCSPNFSDSPAERQRSLNSASHLLNARAELHRSMCHFLAARPEGNGSDDCCENDSAFHWCLRCLFRAGSLNALPYQQPADLQPSFIGTASSRRQAANATAATRAEITITFLMFMSSLLSLIALLRYRCTTLRSRTQQLVQGFSTSVGAKLPLQLMHVGQPRCAYSQSAHTSRRVAHRRNRAVLAA